MLCLWLDWSINVWKPYIGPPLRVSLSKVSSKKGTKVQSQVHRSSAGPALAADSQAAKQFLHPIQSLCAIEEVHLESSHSLWLSLSDYMGRELSLQESGWDPWELCSGITAELVLPASPSVMVAMPRYVCLWSQCTREYTHVTVPTTCRVQIILLNPYKKLWSTSVASFFIWGNWDIEKPDHVPKFTDTVREWAGLYHAVWLLNLCS